jgi:hypothetical protein
MIWCAVGPLYAGAGLASPAQERKAVVVQSRHLPAAQIPKGGLLPKSHNARKYYGLNEASSAAPQKMTIAADSMTRHA